MGSLGKGSSTRAEFCVFKITLISPLLTGPGSLVQLQGPSVAGSREMLANGQNNLSKSLEGRIVALSPVKTSGKIQDLALLLNMLSASLGS